MKINERNHGKHRKTTKKHTLLIWKREIYTLHIHFPPITSEFFLFSLKSQLVYSLKSGPYCTGYIIVHLKFQVYPWLLEWQGHTSHINSNKLLNQYCMDVKKAMMYDWIGWLWGWGCLQVHKTQIMLLHVG